MGEAAVEAFAHQEAAAHGWKSRDLPQIDIERSASALIAKEGSHAAASAWATKRAFELRDLGDRAGYHNMLRISLTIRRRLDTPEDIRARQAYRNEF